MKQITIHLLDDEDGNILVQEVPEGIEVLVIDHREGGHINYGKGNDNILSQKM